MEWPRQTTALFTQGELKKLHAQFHHPTAEKLFQVLQQSSPSDCTPRTRAMLDDITKACGVCARFRPRPLSFQKSLPEDKLVFNHVVSLDLF